MSRRTFRAPSTLQFRLQEFHLLCFAFPGQFIYRNFKLCASGSSNFARHYSQNRCYFLFLILLRYFNSDGLAYLAVY